MSSSTSPVPQVVEGTGAVAKINGNFSATSQAMIGARDDTSTLLNWKYIGGRINGITVANGFVTLTVSTTNYVVMKKSDGVVSVATATTNWDNSTDYWRLYSVVTNATTVTSYEDERSSSTGLFGFGIQPGLANPMTTAGDIIVGGASGTPTRLAAGTATHVLTSNGAGVAPSYQASPAGFANPMTTIGDLIVGGASGVAARLANGTAGQVLKAVSGAPPAWANPVQCIPVACSDETTALTVGVAKVTFRMPYAFTLLAGAAGVRASVTTAPTGSVLTVDINEGGVSILSTKLTIDASEKTSTTAATPAVISDVNLADDAEITIDIDGVGSTIAGAGLKVYLIGYPA
jgi:hypothetical protein